jgi:hypothetical protein
LPATPPIALNAASEQLAIPVNYDKPFPAMVAQHLAALLDHPRLLPKRDELAWSALHGFIVRAVCCREIGRYGDHLLDAQIGVIPKLDAKCKVIVPPSHLPIEEQTKNIVNLTPGRLPNSTPVASVDSL